MTEQSVTPVTAKIIGYRQLSDEEQAVINDIKTIAQSVGAHCALVEKTPGTDQRWLSIAKTDLQKGFMALIRAVARPSTF